MNANELADELERPNNYQQENNFTTQAATMLRQQKAEIEALKKEAALQRLSDFTQKAESFDRTASHMAGEYVAYQKELALTDEEMISIYEKDWSGIKCGLGRAVEQAILRKAKEND